MTAPSPPPRPDTPPQDPPTFPVPPLHPLVADSLWLLAGLALTAGLLYAVLRVGPAAWRLIWGA